jgi:hypothetical protein
MREGAMSETRQLEPAVRDELEALRVRVDRYARAHIRQALRLGQMNDLATLITVIGGITVLTLSAALFKQTITDHTAATSVMIVSGIITLVSVVQAVWKPGERAIRHKGWSSRYAAIENDCRLALCGRGEKNIAQIMAEVAHILPQIDLVPQHVWERAKRSQKKGK